ncbi:hypothetical protein GCM10018966_003590 [Streptomyces yanii]
MDVRKRLQTRDASEGRLSRQGRHLDLEPGDLLFADWDPQKEPDGKIDHAMVISGSYTSLGFTEPTYSQNRDTGITSR